MCLTCCDVTCYILVFTEMRLKELRRGRFMASWKAIVEFEQMHFDAYLWDIDTSSSGEWEKWNWAPDEGKVVQHIT